MFFGSIVIASRYRSPAHPTTTDPTRCYHARIEAKVENRPVLDGDILTACQAACPTRAIVFGDINDETTLVAQMKLQPLTYRMLAELGTQPRTTYLAALLNPNPELTI